MTTVHYIRSVIRTGIYIGRKGFGFEQSPYHNPFKAAAVGRGQAILKFVEYWYAPEQKSLRDRAIVELKDKKLGCWCKPLDCHGDFIAGYVNWKTERTLFS